MGGGLQNESGGLGDSGVQGQRPGRGLGDSPPEAEAFL